MTHPAAVQQPRANRKQAALPVHQKTAGALEGWFAVAFCHELTPGKVLRRQVGSRQLVVFRTEGGTAAVLDAYCPHLGAHLGAGGTVRGDHLRCPFHGFAFNEHGQCVGTPYGSGKTAHLKTRAYSVREAFGAVLCYVSADESEPKWELFSEGPEENDSTTWEKPATQQWRLRTSVQDLYENTVDVAHFEAVHGYSSVRVLKPFSFEGPYLRGWVEMQRSRGPLGPLTPRPFTMRLTIAASGLGHSRVQIRTSLGLELCTVVMATPLDDEHIEARVSVQVKNVGGRFQHWLPQRPIRRLLSQIAVRQMAQDFEQDVPIWENKRYLERPRVVPGDGPIVQYRRWARQFLSPVSVAPRSPS